MKWVERFFESRLEQSLRDVPDRYIAEMALLRTKLEVRTWFLRFSLALNVALLAGALVQIVVL
jgi:hypothetical protein